MGKKKTIVAIVLAICIPAATIGAWAVQDTQTDPFERLVHKSVKQFIVGRIGRMLVFKSQIDLTDGQKKQLCMLVKKHKKEILPTVRTMVDKRRALREAILSDKSNEKTVRKAAEDLSKTFVEAALLANKIVGEAKPVLKPEQWKLIRELKQSNDKAVTRLLNQFDK